MSELKATKGPWRMDTAVAIGPYFVLDAGGYVICRFTPLSSSDKQRKQSEANAHLIASAPDLYEALEEMLCVIENYYEDCQSELPDRAQMQEVRQALAKARGETEAPND